MSSKDFKILAELFAKLAESTKELEDAIAAKSENDDGDSDAS